MVEGGLERWVDRITEGGQTLERRGKVSETWAKNETRYIRQIFGVWRGKVEGTGDQYKIPWIWYFWLAAMLWGIKWKLYIGGWRLYFNLFIFRWFGRFLWNVRYTFQLLINFFGLMLQGMWDTVLFLFTQFMFVTIVIFYVPWHEISSMCKGWKFLKMNGNDFEWHLRVFKVVFWVQITRVERTD